MGGARYALSIVDDYSRYGFVCLLASKSDVAERVIEVVSWIETQTGQRVRTVRSDNGTEFVNQTLRAFYAQRGITHQTSTRYTPQQNGVAERFNQTIQIKVRPMLAESGVGAELWGEVWQAACYLRNLSPVADRELTPWELFHGTCPDVSHLRVWGCIDLRARAADAATQA